jgi:uncharacterized repeat protein (TIGR01451 family)
MINTRPTLTWLTLAAIITLLSGIIFLPVASAAPPAQDPRPTVGPPSGGNGTGSGGGSGTSGDSGFDQNSCASLLGQVINWGYGGEGGVTLDLGNGSWQLSTVSATDGNYGFGGLGVGVANLHVALSPEQAETLQPHIQDSAVYLNCDYPTIANFAVSGSNVIPPATISMSAGRTALGAGDGTEIMLTVENNLPTDITNVIVTDFFPNGLSPLEVSTVAATDARIVSAPGGQLAAVYLDRLASGEEVNIRILVLGAGDLPAATRLTNTATLFYRESVADQASLDFSIGRGSVLVVEPTAALEATPEVAGQAATATPEPEPTVEPGLEASPEPTEESETGEEFVPPGGLPTTGDDFIPPGFLPATGEIILTNTGAGLLWPLGLFTVAVLAIAGHYLLSRYRHKK